jgi:hypothetical protein
MQRLRLPACHLLKNMRYLLLLFSLLFVFAACEKSSKDCDKIVEEGYFSNHAEVDTLTRPGDSLIALIQPGNKIVFSYTWYYNPCAMVLDGPGVESLVFQVDDTLTHFKLYDDDLVKARCYYHNSCIICKPHPAVVPGGGIIEGTKLNNNSWSVTIDLKAGAMNPSPIKASATFVLK